MHSFLSWSLAIGLLAVLTSATPYKHFSLNKRNATERLVFAHFMMGIVSNRQNASDYDNDMKLAKSAGIDAFALNIGTDNYTETQLNFAYASAAKNNMSVFISFDFNWFSPSADATTVGKLTKAFASKKAQLKVDGRVFVSSFVGNGLDVEAVRQAAGTEIYFAPNFRPSTPQIAKTIDGALNWVAWDSNGENRAPKGGKNVPVASGDGNYTAWLGSDKGYIAPVSPWFNTHYGPEVSYPKNWVFPSDLLWFNRWNEILTTNSTPQFLEIITWNDYGESHYIGPLSSKHTDDGNSKWANDMPHTGWLEMATPFIKAYKEGKKEPVITEEKLIYWYRPTPKTVKCNGTDTTGSPPDGAETLEDSVFVVALLKDKGQITAISGMNSQTFNATAGAQAFRVPMGVGAQTFSLKRNGKTIMEATSQRDILNECPCGIYNYNAYVGTVPASNKADALDADGLAGLMKGLNSSCSATPSLPIRMPGATGSTRPLRVRY